MSSSGRRCPGCVVAVSILGAWWDGRASVGLWVCLRGHVSGFAVCSPRVLGWGGAGATKFLGPLEKSKDLSSPPLSPHPKGPNWVVLCNNLHEEISFTSDHTCICVSPLAIIMV